MSGRAFCRSRPLVGATCSKLWTTTSAAPAKKSGEVAADTVCGLRPNLTRSRITPITRASNTPIHPNGAVTLVAEDEMPQGFSKQMDVSVHPTKAQVRINHRLVNVVDEPQTVAPWMLSVMNAGGIAIVPQPAPRPHPGMGPGDFAPNRSLILWPFTDLSDSRYHLGERFWTVQQRAGLDATKIGLNSPIEWAAYFLDGTLFVKRWSFDKTATYPDQNSAFELYTDNSILELETLGPLTTLKPGGVVEAVEEWELFEDIADFDPRDPDAVADMIESVGL